MSAAENPAWVRFKKEFDDPSLKSRIVFLALRLVILFATWHFTQSRLLALGSMLATALVPEILIPLIDTLLRIQFSLQALLVSILTLQLPVMLFFTAETGVGIGLGVSLLLIWVLVFGAYVKIRLAIANEDSAERSAS